MNHQNYIKPSMIYAGVAVVAVGYHAFHYVKVVREERAKRREIAAKLQRSLGVGMRAHEAVAKRFMEGVYTERPNPIYDMLVDLEFEQIVEFNKE